MGAQSTTRRTGDPHPLYTAVSREHRWTGGSLESLYMALRRLAVKRTWLPAESEADRDFSWMALRNGAVVSMRRRGDLDDRMELRIARSEAPQTPTATAKFEAEVATFLRHFGIVAGDGLTPSEIEGRVWLRLPITAPGDHGKAVARFLELRLGECAPGKALCHVCLQQGQKTVVSWFPPGGFRGQRCDHHVGE